MAPGRDHSAPSCASNTQKARPGRFVPRGAPPPCLSPAAAARGLPMLQESAPCRAGARGALRPGLRFALPGRERRTRGARSVCARAATRTRNKDRRATFHKVGSDRRRAVERQVRPSGGRIWIRPRFSSSCSSFFCSAAAAGTAADAGTRRQSACAQPERRSGRDDAVKPQARGRRMRRRETLSWRGMRAGSERSPHDPSGQRAIVGAHGRTPGERERRRWIRSNERGCPRPRSKPN